MVLTEQEPPLYRDKRLRLFAEGYRIKEFHAFERQLKKRLIILLGARCLNDLRLLPSNHFEALGGDRNVQYSIRINQQWRLCFEWREKADHASNIEAIDYH